MNEKCQLVEEIFQDAVQQLLVANPNQVEKLHGALQFVKAVLPSVFEMIDTASKKALVAPVKKTDSWKQCLEIFHGVSCFLCQKVEVPVALPNKKELLKQGKQFVVVMDKPTLDVSLLPPALDALPAPPAPPVLVALPALVEQPDSDGLMSSIVEKTNSNKVSEETHQVTDQVVQ
jgi:hypothetical protein